MKTFFARPCNNWGTLAVATFALAATTPYLRAQYTATALGPVFAAQTINSSGTVVGTVEVPPNAQVPYDSYAAFTFSGGTMTDLTVNGVTASFGVGINDAGTIVGQFTSEIA